MYARDQLIAEFDAIRRAQRKGVYAPHKPLLLLLALAHVQHGAPRLEPFKAYDSAMKSLLASFGPSSGAGSRHYPYWHLKTDGKGALWTLNGPEHLLARPPALTPNLGELRDECIVAGFSESAHALLRREPYLLMELAERILDANFPPSLHDDILSAVGLSMTPILQVAEPVPSYLTSVKRRRDAGFRERVLLAYEYRCCVCGFDLRICHMPAGIEAAHIQWHTADGPDVTPNGLSLCATHHKLFDLGAFTIEPGDLRVLYSQHAIGEGATQFHGQVMRCPQDLAQLPAAEYLQWNQANVFKTPVRR